MRLVSFHVTSFRSITDSGSVEAADRTVLVGRNESGKTAILKALHGIKGRHFIVGDPTPKEMVEFSLARDFPRDRPRSEFKADAVVTSTRWSLTALEQLQLGAVWPRARKAKHVTVSRQYKTSRSVGIEDQIPLSSYIADGRKGGDKAVRLLQTSIKGDAAKLAACEAAITTLSAAIALEDWGDAQVAAATAFRAAVAGAGIEIPKAAEESLKECEACASAVLADDQQAQAARNWVAKTIPTFVYLDEWEQVTGHHVISSYIQRRTDGNRLAQDFLLDKLLKVSDLNAEELQSLLTKQHEERTLLTDRASRVFTKRLQELWKDRELEVQFRIDADHFDVLIKDTDTNALVPLDERSRGFRWYFSFYVTFTADTLGGDKQNAILLLDEPGLFLHATAQGQLLQFFKDLKNQIVYSTHSPFMIDPDELHSVRTVSLASDTGTVVSEDLSGDSRTLFPLQAALGYDITQTLFIGSKNVVIEGVTDYWYLSSVAEYLREQNKATLPVDIVLTPAGGAQKVSYLVSLLTAQNLHVVVLLDSEPAALRTRDDLVKNKLIRKDAVVEIADAFSAPIPKEADVEDLIDPGVFVALVNEAYKSELKGKTLALNAKIPRIVPRFEDAFEASGLTFAKSRIARLFLSKMGVDPKALLIGNGEQRFVEILQRLAGAVEKIGKTDRKPFE